MAINKERNVSVHELSMRALQCLLIEVDHRTPPDTLNFFFLIIIYELSGIVRLFEPLLRVFNGSEESWKNIECQQCRGNNDLRHAS
jgi:hypothetical protein